ncbi:hypothetical protein FOI68_12195 [Brevibacillus sp. LEMMJ03]|jgi:hypothetical protein|uniref:hypothetical protein n=1 Tax=Brevibacillus sp. LEMMJ03 TaxID=2595056 RepID=UPI00117D2639|nr:hypothetical protein [Brevibacillus sp. LEMMJ03]TRY25565.1 hypothetical protein FOI68_12195 [Brevibacillus sp. LEMMJ03]
MSGRRSAEKGKQGQQGNEKNTGERRQTCGHPDVSQRHVNSFLDVLRDQGRAKAKALIVTNIVMFQNDFQYGFSRLFCACNSRLSRLSGKERRADDGFGVLAASHA